MGETAKGDLEPEVVPGASGLLELDSIRMCNLKYIEKQVICKAVQHVHGHHTSLTSQKLYWWCTGWCTGSPRLLQPAGCCCCWRRRGLQSPAAPETIPRTMSWAPALACSHYYVVPLDTAETKFPASLTSCTGTMLPGRLYPLRIVLHRGCVYRSSRQHHARDEGLGGGCHNWAGLHGRSSRHCMSGGTSAQY